MIIEKFKEAFDNDIEFGALLADLSKAFGCIDYTLLLENLYGYRVSHTSFKLIFSY